MPKAVLDIHYEEKDKILYESFIIKLEREGWKQEHISIDCKHGRGKYFYRSMVRRVVK